MVSALAAASLAAAGAARGGVAAVGLAAFIATLVAVAYTRLPAPAAIAVGAALAAAVALARPGWTVAAAAAAGIFAALWAAVLDAQGLPFVAAVGVAAAIGAASAALSARRGHFAPRDLRDEALALVVVLGVCAGAAGPIVEGWRVGVTLAAQPLESPSFAAGAWLPAVVVGCLLLGGLFSLWRRR